MKIDVIMFFCMFKVLSGTAVVEPRCTPSPGDDLSLTILDIAVL